MLVVEATPSQRSATSSMKVLTARCRVFANTTRRSFLRFAYPATETFLVATYEQASFARNKIAKWNSHFSNRASISCQKTSHVFLCYSAESIQIDPLLYGQYSKNRYALPYTFLSKLSIEVLHAKRWATLRQWAATSCIDDEHRWYRRINRIIALIESRCYVPTS